MTMPASIQNFLLVDASSPDSIIVGMLGDNQDSWLAFSEEKTAALEGIFSAAETVIKQSQIQPKGYIFCSGPGSILGIRIAAMAIRTWISLSRTKKPVLSYQSLNLYSALIARALPQEKNFAVLAESRMNRWNALRTENGVPEKKFRELKSEDLAGTLPERVFILPQRRSTVPDLPVPAVPLVPAEFIKRDPAVFSCIPDILSDCGGAPDAINTAAVDSYAKWVPGRHK